MTQTTPSHSQAVEAAEREKFEAHFKLEAPGCDLRFANGMFTNSCTRNTWEGWLARAALTSPQEVAAPVSDERADEIANACYHELLVTTTYNGGMGGQTWDRALVRAAIAASRVPVASLAEPVAEVLAEGDTIRLKHRLPMGTKLYATPPMAVGAGGDVGAVEKHEWLQESSYRAGAKAGFNLGIAENHEGLHALLAAHQYPRPTPEQATTGSGQELTPDELVECMSALRDHDGSDFEPECPGCTAYKKLAAILSTASPAGEVKS